MTKEEKRPGVAPPSPAHRGRVFFLVATALVIALFTGGIAYETQTVLGVSEKPAEGTMVDGVRTFNITVEQWSFTPAAIKVNPGENVTFYITSKDVWHGFTINELNINVTVPGGKTVQANAVIPAGTKDQIYTMYCSVFCGLGHPYLKGQVIVGNPKLLFGVGLGKIMPYAATLAMVVVFAVAVVIEGRRGK